MRSLVLIGFGLAAGYLYGFRDAQHNVKPLQRRVAEQVVGRVGGASRDRVGGNIDARMDRASR